jgi:hypothetical protein
VALAPEMLMISFLLIGGLAVLVAISIAAVVAT